LHQKPNTGVQVGAPGVQNPEAVEVVVGYSAESRSGSESIAETDCRLAEVTATVCQDVQSVGKARPAGNVNSRLAKVIVRTPVRASCRVEDHLTPFWFGACFFLLYCCCCCFCFFFFFFVAAPQTL
jgi:hypothetical protein